MLFPHPRTQMGREGDATTQAIWSLIEIENGTKIKGFLGTFEFNGTQVNLFRSYLNPISGRLLATPISGRGAVYDPLDISRSNGPIFKIQMAFDFTQFDLHFLKEKIEKYN